MKRHWKVRREFHETTDAARRWDQAYQKLLQWSQPGEPIDPLQSPLCHPQSEITHEDSDLRPRLDRSSNARSNH